MTAYLTAFEDERDTVDMAACQEAYALVEGEIEATVETKIAAAKYLFGEQEDEG